MYKGIALKIVSAFAFSCMSATAKSAGDHYPLAQIVFFRSFFALVVLVIWLAAIAEFPSGLRTRRPWGHVLRAIWGSCGMFFGFLSLMLLPLADATALGYAAPLMTVALAALLLGETVRIYRWSAVGIGLVGVLVMLSDHLGVHPGGGPHRLVGVMASLGGAVCAAVATIQTRRLTKSEGTGAIVFYFSLMTTLVSGAICLAAVLWPAGAPWAAAVGTQFWVMPQGAEWVRLIAVGVFGGIGQILMTQSFRHADASIIACFDYTSMLWALAFSIFIFQELPSSAVLTGAAIVAAAGLFVIWREQRLGLIKSEVKRAGPGRPM